MVRILLIGKGELFSSVVNYLSTDISNDRVSILPYDQFQNLQNAVNEKRDFQEIEKWRDYKRIYLFPDSVNEGIVNTSFISEWCVGILFVVTQNIGCNFLYKRLGADYVIHSKPDCKMYRWFPEESNEIFLY